MLTETERNILMVVIDTTAGYAVLHYHQTVLGGYEIQIMAPRGVFWVFSFAAWERIKSYQ